MLCLVLNGLIGSDLRREAFGKAARLRAEACFDVRKVARRFVEVYRGAS